MLTRRWLPAVTCAAVLIVLIALALGTIQTIPNGSSHPWMIDVGETQVVLNVWGTLHATGYPLYIMLSAALVSILNSLGIGPATTPALTSLLWGTLALALVYALSFRLTRQTIVCALVLLCYGLTRFVWLHQSIAEIYSFGLLLLALLLFIALGMTGHERARLLTLAFVGGLALAHHRAFIVVIPPLLYAMLPALRQEGRRLPVVLVSCLLLGLAGFLPYLYLPARAHAGANWVYGDPGTLQGFLDQFLGREAARFIGMPGSLEAVLANVVQVSRAVIDDVTLPGLLIGTAGLFAGVVNPATRRAAVTLTLLGCAAWLFHGLFYTDLLVMLLMIISLPLAFGWLFAGSWLVRLAERRSGLIVAAVGAVGLVAAVGLYSAHHAFIRGLTADPAGLAVVATWQRAPAEATAMIAWGPQHFAAGFARDVLDLRTDVRLFDHNATRDQLLADARPLIALPDDFYNRPQSWWEARLESPVFLTSPAPGWVEVRTSPVMAQGTVPETITVRSATVLCDFPASLALVVDWQAGQEIVEDESVFVHVLNASGALIGQGDQSAPVYGLRPVSTWLPGEVVRDTYPVPLSGEVPAAIRFGLYRVEPDGSFLNTLELEISTDCGDMTS
jgi:hypothetical protein